jgi:hypothetical protein
MTAAIDRCCDGMGTMIKEGAIEPYTTFGYETVIFQMRGE